MGSVIVIREYDRSDNELDIICVASSREKALELIEEYYGKGEHTIENFKDVREDNIDFKCRVVVGGKFGGVYDIVAEDFYVDCV